jgi:hypothetical protein
MKYSGNKKIEYIIFETVYEGLKIQILTEDNFKTEYKNLYPIFYAKCVYYFLESLVF